MTTRSATHGQIRGWHVLLMMLAFFGAVIGVNVFFAIEAVNSFPGEEVQSPYQQGLHYNDTLAARRAQAQLGWRANAELQASDGGAVLVVTMRDRTGVALDGLSVTGALRWPTDAARDRTLTFQSIGRGQYRAVLGDLRPGYWRLEAHAVGVRQGALDFDSDLAWPRR